MVEPVAVTGGVFHAKICSLVGESGSHLIIGSGNLTFGGWGCNMEVVEHLTAAAHASAFADTAEFLAEVPYASRVTLEPNDVLSEHVDQLRAAAGDAVEGSVRVLHNVHRGILAQLVDYAESLGGAERLTVVSPYFGGTSAVEQLARELGLDTFEVHVASRVAVNGEHYGFHRVAAAIPVVVEAVAVDATTNRPLHAKLIEILCSRGRLLLSGSVNASQPALVQPINVELGVLRITEDRTVLPRQQHTGELPELPKRAELESADSLYVARCEYAGGLLQGALLRPTPAGEWIVSVDADGDREQLGAVEVSAAGAFRMDAPSLERHVYSPRRTVLTFSRVGEKVRGFLSFTDVLSASRRLGSIAAPLLRIAAGSDQDEDWIGILEWFARNPEETVKAWRHSRPGQAAEREDQLVPLSSLAPQPDPTRGGGLVSAASVAATLDRLLARLRLVVRRTELNPTRPANRTAVEDECERAATEADRRRSAKLASAFDRLIEVLADRVPADPAAELTRLAELGVHVLQRHPEDAERIVGFLRRWLHLACDHLRPAADDEELRKLTVGIVALAAVYDDDPRRGRRQLLDILGRNFRDADLKLDTADPDRRSLIDLVSATVGIEAWLDVLNRLAHIRVRLDDVREILGALAEGRDLPELPTLEHSEELAQLKKLLAKGKMASIYQEPRTKTGCPRCNLRLPVARIEQFRQSGLVRNDCCNGIMLRNDA
jgi:hypothetical protein